MIDAPTPSTWVRQADLGFGLQAERSCASSPEGFANDLKLSRALRDLANLMTFALPRSRTSTPRTNPDICSPERRCLIAELHDILPPVEQLLKLCKESGPPQSWYDEEDD